MSFVGKMKISLTKLVVFEFKRFRKKLLITCLMTVSNNTSSDFLGRSCGYDKLVSLYIGKLVYSEKCLTSMTVVKCDDAVP